MPGVTVTTSLRTGGVGANVAPASTLFIIGTSERGPAASPLLLTSFADFEKYFGDYTSSGTLYQHLQVYFEEGGLRAYTQRVIGTGGVAASATLSNTGSAVITLNAVGVGTWANGSASAGLQVVVSGSGATRTVQVKNDGVTVWTSAPLSTRDSIVSDINANVGYLMTATAGATDALPDAATTSFSAGANDSAATAANHTDALTGFGYELGPGVVIIAEQGLAVVSGSSTVGAIIGTHCLANNRLGFVAANSSATGSATLVTDASSLASTLGIENSSYVAAFFPHITVPIRIRNSANSTLTLTVQSTTLAAAKRAQAHLAQGPWRAGAGEIGASNMGAAMATAFNKSIGDTLDDSRINALRVVNDTTRIYGARSISTDETNWRFYTSRDTINFAVGQIEQALEAYVFRPIDSRGNLFAQIAASCTAIMEKVRLAGGLYELVDTSGVALDRGYTVVCDSTNNPAAQIAAGEVRATVNMRVSNIGDTIAVTIYKTGLTSGV